MEEDTAKQEIDHGLKLIAMTSFIGFVTIILSKLFVYLYKVIIFRYFGPETYGVFSLAVMVSSLFMVFSSFGLFEGLVRYVALYRGKKQVYKARYLYDLSLTILIFSSLVAGLLLFMFSRYIAIDIFHNEELVFFLRVFSVLVPLSVLTDALLSIMRAYEIIGWYSFISSAARNGIKLVLLILLILFGIKGGAVAFSYVLGTLLTLIAAYLVFKYKISRHFVRKDFAQKEKKTLRSEFFHYSLPLTLSTFIFMIFNWLDTFAIGFFKGAVEVGLYNTAVPIAMLLAVAPDLFMRIFFPLISREYSKKNTGVIKELSKQTSKWIFIINAPALVLIMLFPGAALNILFGPESLAAENALRILAIGFFISTGIGAICLRLISMIGRSKTILANTIVASLINLVLNFILVPMPKIGPFDNSLGLTGAALATLVSLIVMGIMLCWQSYRYLNIIPLRRTMARIVAALVIPTAILIYIRSLIVMNLYSLIMLASLFFLLYTMGILIFRALDRNDFLIIRSITDKIKQYRQ